jgi:hypothetical protein
MSLKSSPGVCCRLYIYSRVISSEYLSFDELFIIKYVYCYRPLPMGYLPYRRNLTRTLTRLFRLFLSIYRYTSPGIIYCKMHDSPGVVLMKAHRVCSIGFHTLYQASPVVYYRVLLPMVSLTGPWFAACLQASPL